MFKNYTKNLSGKMPKYWKLILVVVFLFGLFLRWWHLPQNLFNFEYDQARDAYVAQQIIGGHLKILGPPTSGVPGLFHGVLYYYVITPAYFLGHGSPTWVAFWLSLINALGIFTVFYLAYLLTKKVGPALISSLIFAFSFDAIQFSGFLSNVSMGVWFVPLIYIGLYLWIKKGYKWAPILTGLALGLSVQSEIAFYYHLIPVAIWLWVYRKNISFKEIFLSGLSFALGISTMLVSEVKFGFPGVKGLIYLFTSQDAAAQGKQFSDFLITYMNQVGTRMAETLFPFNIVFGSLVGFLMLAYSILKKSFIYIFLATYILAHFIALPFGGSTTPHIMIGAIPGIAVFTGIFLWENFRKYKVLIFLLVALLMFVNIAKLVSQGKSRHSDLYTNYVYLSTELQAVDYTYQKANGQPFSISTLTAPLYINTLWSYLYNWYGRQKYGYVPYWIGRDQIGQLGDNLSSPSGNVKEHFFIKEPTEGIPEIWITYAMGDQNSMSDLVGTQKFGELTVEERIMKSDK